MEANKLLEQEKKQSKYVVSQPPIPPSSGGACDYAEQTDFVGTFLNNSDPVNAFTFKYWFKGHGKIGKLVKLPYLVSVLGASAFFIIETFAVPVPIIPTTAMQSQLHCQVETLQ